MTGNISCSLRQVYLKSLGMVFNSKEGGGSMGGGVKLKFSISIELGLIAHSISSRLRSLDSNSSSSFDSSVISSLCSLVIFSMRLTSKGWSFVS